VLLSVPPLARTTDVMKVANFLGMAPLVESMWIFRTLSSLRGKSSLKCETCSQPSHRSSDTDPSTQFPPTRLASQPRHVMQCLLNTEPTA
jgi:hypothetical protein